MSNAVEVYGLSMAFGKETVLNHLNIHFEAGKIHGIVGRNGSGKTVLFKCILGFLAPTRGYATVFGRRIGHDCDFAPDTGMIIESPGFIPTESGRDNLNWLLGLRGKRKKGCAESAMRLVGLDPANGKPVGKYSLGMRQRLGIAQAIMEKPGLLILDEPLNSLDNRGVEQMRSLFLQLRDEGATMLIASHNPIDVAVLCDAVYEMDGGVLTPKQKA